MAGDFGLPRSNRIADAWGHFAPELLCASVLAAIALGLHPVTTPLTLTLPLSLIAFVLATWVLMRRHDRRLCEHCVASMPLNAAEKATHYQRRFWLAHIGSRPVFLVPYLAVLVGSNFLPGLFGHVVWAVAQLSMIYLIASHTTHRRLQPWCPWCSDQGGGSSLDDAPGPLPLDRVA